MGGRGATSLGFGLTEGVVGLATVAGKLGVWGREDDCEGDLTAVAFLSVRAVTRTSAELGVVVRCGLVMTILFTGPGRLDVAAEVAFLAQPAVRGSPLSTGSVKNRKGTARMSHRLPHRYF